MQIQDSSQVGCEEHENFFNIDKIVQVHQDCYNQHMQPIDVMFGASSLASTIKAETVQTLHEANCIM